jgi:hypothetical protein
LDTRYHIKNARIPNIRAVKDAIYITQRLGIQYFWIDSQCILQDHREDWEKGPANIFSMKALSSQSRRHLLPMTKARCLVTRRRWSMGSGEREVINAFSVISGTIYSLYFG